MTNLDPNGSERPEPGTGLDNGGDGKEGDSCDEYAEAWDRMVAAMQAELEGYAAAWDRMSVAARATRLA